MVYRIRIRSDAVVIIKDFDDSVGYPHIHLTFDEFARDGVWHPVDGYVM